MSSHRVVKYEYEPHAAWHMPDVCYYCCEPATTLDHVIPVAWSNDMSLEALDDFHRYMVTVPACRDCNLRLGKRVLLRLEDRRSFLAASLRKKYKNLLRSRDSDRHELDELGANLRQYIEARAVLRAHVRRRLQFLDRAVSPSVLRTAEGADDVRAM